MLRPIRLELFGAVIAVAFCWVDAQAEVCTFSSPGPNVRAIAVSNAGSALTDYPVNFRVPYDSAMRSDFGDIRFRDTDGTDLKYWVENYQASTSANVWVRIPAILANSSKTIYLFYGDSTATSMSDGHGTFPILFNGGDSAGDFFYYPISTLLCSGTPGALMALGTELRAFGSGNYQTEIDFKQVFQIPAANAEYEIRMSVIGDAASDNGNATTTSIYWRFANGDVTPVYGTPGWNSIAWANMIVKDGTQGAGWNPPSWSNTTQTAVFSSGSATNTLEGAFYRHELKNSGQCGQPVSFDLTFTNLLIRPKASSEPTVTVGQGAQAMAVPAQVGSISPSTLMAVCGQGASGTLSAQLQGCPSSTYSWNPVSGPPVDVLTTSDSRSVEIRTRQTDLQSLIGQAVVLNVTAIGGPGNTAAAQRDVHIGVEPFISVRHRDEPLPSSDSDILGMEVSLSNPTACPLSGVEYQETLHGLRYVSNSARANGMPAVANLVGDALVFSGIDLPGSASAQLAYQARPALVYQQQPSGQVLFNQVLVSQADSSGSPRSACEQGSKGSETAWVLALLAVVSCRFKPRTTIRASRPASTL